MGERDNEIDITPLVQAVGLSLVLLVNELHLAKAIDKERFKTILDAAPDFIRKSSLPPEFSKSDLTFRILEQLIEMMQGANDAGRRPPTRPFRPIVISGGRS